MKRFLRQMQQNRRVLADGVQYYRFGELRSHFAQNVDALGFESPQVRELRNSH